VKAFFDTSVLVAAFYADHEHHAASLDLLVGFPKKVGCCAAHSLVEVYSTLTRMPGKHRVNGEQAMLFIADLEERLSIVGLDPHEYVAALAGFASLKIAGGAVYDAFLAACALNARAERIFTWNLRHYAQLGPEVAKRLKTP